MLLYYTDILLYWCRGCHALVHVSSYGLCRASLSPVCPPCPPPSSLFPTPTRVPPSGIHLRCPSPVSRAIALIVPPSGVANTHPFAHESYPVDTVHTVHTRSTHCPHTGHTRSTHGPHGPHTVQSRFLPCSQLVHTLFIPCSYPVNTPHPGPSPSSPCLSAATSAPSPRTSHRPSAPPHRSYYLTTPHSLTLPPTPSHALPRPRTPSHALARPSLSTLTTLVHPSSP